MANDITLKITIDGKEATAVISNLSGQLGGLEKKGSDSGKGFGNSWSMALTGINQGLELVNKAMGYLSKPIEAAAQFEGFETSLKVMLGSTEKAKERLKELTDFAASTPFELPQVVTLGNQLQAIGKYSKENMTNLGDLAAAAGKPIEQVTGAFAKLATGQKGIAVDMFRDLLISTKDWEQAVGKSIDKITSDEMMGKLPEIMKSKGFAGMMEEQSKTFSGMMSNFQDSIGALMRAIGEQVLPIAKSIIGTITPIFGFIKDNLGTLLTAIQIITPAAIAFGTAWAYNNLMMSASVTTIIPKLITSIIAFGTTLKTFVLANPVLVVVTALGAAVGALEAYSSRVKDVFNETGELYDQLKKSNDTFIDSMRKGTPEQIKQAIAQSEYNKELAKTLMMKNTEANFTASAWESIKGTVMNILKGENVAVASMNATLQNGVLDLNETGKKARDEYKAAEDRINKLNDLLKEKQAGKSSGVTTSTSKKTESERLLENLQKEKALLEQGIGNREKYEKKLFDLHQKTWHEMDQNEKLRTKDRIALAEYAYNELVKLDKEYKKKISEKPVTAEDWFAQMDQGAPVSGVAGPDWNPNADRELQFDIELWKKKHEIAMTGINAIKAGWQTMWSENIMVSRQAANSWDAVWLSIENSALGALGKILETEIENMLVSVAVHETAEATKTASTEQGVLARIASLAIETVSTLASGAASILTAIAKGIEGLLEWMGPWGLLGIPAMIAAITGAYFGAKSLLGFAEGGLLPQGKAGIIEGWHNEIIAPERTFVDVMRTNIMPQLAFAGGGISTGRLENKLDQVINAFQSKEFRIRGRDIYTANIKEAETKKEI